MCLKRVNWQQYILSVLLLIIVLASNSSQQKLFSSPRPFQTRYSKAVDNDQEGFMPIIPPTEYKPTAAAAAAPVTATDITKHDEPVTILKPMAIMEADRRIDTDEIDETDESVDREGEESNDEEAFRSINHSIQELQEMTTDFLAIIKQNSGIQKRSTDQQRNFITDYLFNDQVINRVKKFTEKYIFQAASGSAIQNIVPAGGRLFFFKGITTNCFDKK